VAKEAFKSIQQGLSFLSKRPGLWCINLGLLLFLVSCVEAPKNSTAKQGPIPTSTSDQQSPIPQGTTNSVSELMSGTPSSLALQGVNYSFSPTIKDTGVIISGFNLPSWMSVDATTGRLSGVPIESAVHNNISLIATKGSTYSRIGPFSILIKGDLLGPDQWHLNNTAQENYALNGGVAGVDLNLSQAYTGGFTGLGIKVAVSDSGLTLYHEDLDDNLSATHKNYFLDSPFIGSPEPFSNSGDHGTSVAGIIAAEGWNDIGVRGVAPDATLTGLRYVGSSADTERTLDQAQGPYDIFNYSYGYNFVNFNFPWDGTYQDQLLDGFINGRDGKGQIYVKSAGNSYRECDFFYAGYYGIEGGGICFNHNANMDSDNVTIPMIVVGAMNAKGQRSSYSSAGSSLWISAFGGEFGEDDPAILTTDQVGCTIGYSRTSDDGSDFQKGLDPNNKDCNYTHTFNGTSAAAPMISGIVALMLQANPELMARDVKHILAKTARAVNDPSFQNGVPHINGNFFELPGHEYEQNTITNAAGFNFHNWFGFGLVDGDAAVEMARSYVSSWGPLVHLNKDFSSSTYRRSLGSSIPDDSATGLTSGIFVSASLTIEAVQIKLNVSHGRPGDLGVELTSPSGTKSILLNINNSMLIPDDDSGEPAWVADLTDFVMASNAFYGENSRGTWTLKIVDGLGGSTGTEYDKATSQVGTLTNWSLNISGH
jgi:subtilisin-like proprotein convertase family protein